MVCKRQVIYGELRPSNKRDMMLKASPWCLLHYDMFLNELLCQTVDHMLGLNTIMLLNGNIKLFCSAGAAQFAALFDSF